MIGRRKASYDTIDKVMIGLDHECHVSHGFYYCRCTLKKNKWFGL